MFSDTFDVSFSISSFESRKHYSDIRGCLNLFEMHCWSQSYLYKIITLMIDTCKVATASALGRFPSFVWWDALFGLLVGMCFRWNLKLIWYSNWYAILVQWLKQILVSYVLFRASVFKANFVSEAFEVQIPINLFVEIWTLIDHVELNFGEKLVFWKISL